MMLDFLVLLVLVYFHYYNTHAFQKQVAMYMFVLVRDKNFATSTGFLTLFLLSHVIMHKQLCICTHAEYAGCVKGGKIEQGISTKYMLL